MRFKKFQHEGFTLVELIVVITVISVLASVVFIAVDPARRFNMARISTRWSDVGSIAQAIRQYHLDNGATMPSTPTAIDSNASTVQLIGESVGSCGGTCAGYTVAATNCGVNSLDTDLAPYLKKIPKDPKTGTDNNTGYYVNISNGAVVVGACTTEGEGVSGAGGAVTPTMTQSPTGNQGTEANGVYTYNISATQGWTGGFVGTSSYARQAGLTFEWTTETAGTGNGVTDYFMVGLGNGSLSGNNYANLAYGFYFVKNMGGSYTFYIYQDGTNYSSFGTANWNDVISVRIIITATGADYYYKVNSGAWTLGYSTTYVSPTTNLYPMITPYTGNWKVYNLSLYGGGIPSGPTIEVAK
jgi:prepilin-type N-terminal cleavage/methylation domain-containing protein